MYGPMNLSVAPGGGEVGGRRPSVARSLGAHVRCHGMKYITVALVIGFLVVAIYFMASIAESEAAIANAEQQEADSMLGVVANAANSIKHMGCRGNGGCGRRCPHIHSDDPRFAIGNLADSIENMYTTITNTAKSERSATDTTMRTFTASMKEKTAADVKYIQDICDKTITNLSTLMTAARGLDSKYASAATVTVDVVNAKNTAIALEAAATLNRNVFVGAIIYLESYLTNARLSDFTDLDQHRIPDYERLISECTAFMVSIKASCEKLNAMITTTLDAEGKTLDASSTYGSLLTALANPASADQIVVAMAGMVNSSQASNDMIKDMGSKFDAIVQIAEKCTIKDTFTNDLPGKPSSETVSAMIANGDYNAALIQTALEPDLVKNHQKFAKERATFDSGGGVPSEFDHDMDLVPFVGLFGKSSYQRSDGTSAENSEVQLKQISSLEPDQLMRSSVPRLTFK